MAVDTKKFEVVRFDAAKATVVETDTIVTANINAIALLMNEVDNVRQNEITNGWRKLRNRIIEDELYTFTLANSINVFMPLGGSNADIQTTSDIGLIPEGSLIISISGNYRASQRGSEIFNAMVEYCVNAAHDEYFKRV